METLHGNFGLHATVQNTLFFLRCFLCRTPTQRREFSHQRLSSFWVFIWVQQAVGFPQQVSHFLKGL